MITFYIDKISSPVLDYVRKAREALRYLYPASECSRNTYSNHTNKLPLRFKPSELVSANSSDPDNCSILCNYYEDVGYHITLRVCQYL